MRHDQADSAGAEGRASRARATLVGVAAILLWAVLAPLTVFAELPTFQLLAMSFGVAFASGIGLLACRGPAALAQLRQPAAPWTVAFVAIFGYHALYFYALSAAPPADASLINYLWPLLIVLLASRLPGGRLAARHLLGSLLGLGGTAVIILGRGGGSAAGTAPVAGYAAAFACALIWSSYSVSNRFFGKTPSTMIVGVCGAVAVAGSLLHLALEDTVVPTLGQAIAVLSLGIGPTGLAFLAWDHATKHGHVPLLGTLSYLAPLLSTLLLVVLGHAPATPQLATAAALIVGGAALATVPVRKTPVA